MIVVGKILCFIGLVFGFFLLFYKPLREHKWQDKIAKFRDKEKQDFVKRKQNRYVQDYFNFPFAKWLDDTYKYSRFYAKTIRGKHTKLNKSINYFFASIITSVGVGVIYMLLAKRFVTGFIVMLAVFAMFYFYLFILRAKNNQAVSNDLINFLNLLGNYSTGNTEIMSVFMQIAPKVSDPLRTCLIECVAEAQNVESAKIKALMNLEAKLENHKFREVLTSMIISQEYSSSFTQTVAHNRRTISSFIKAQKEKKALAEENAITVIVAMLALLAIIGVLGEVIGQSVFTLMLTTTMGNVVLVIAIACILYFVWKIVEVTG